MVGKGIIRPPGDIVNEKGEKVGYVTSGTFGPSVGMGVGMAFLKTEFAEVNI